MFKVNGLLFTSDICSDFILIVDFVGSIYMNSTGNRPVVSVKINWHLPSAYTLSVDYECASIVKSL